MIEKNLLFMYQRVNANDIKTSICPFVFCQFVLQTEKAISLTYARNQRVYVNVEQNGRPLL